MTGAIPLYLCPERNELGIIGPIPLSEFSPESISAKIDASPLTRAGRRKSSWRWSPTRPMTACATTPS
jgi:arginine/lysine/ornithine decarboxylase